MHSENFKLQHNETILSLKYSKLAREQNENAEEWKGCPRLEANERGCKKATEGSEQFINGVMKKV